MTKPCLEGEGSELKPARQTTAARRAPALGVLRLDSPRVGELRTLGRILTPLPRVWSLRVVMQTPA